MRASQESEPPRTASEEVLFTQLATGVTADPSLTSRSRKRPGVVVLALSLGVLVALGAVMTARRGSPTVGAEAIAAPALETAALPPAPRDLLGAAQTESMPLALDAGEMEAPTSLASVSPRRSTPHAPVASPKRGRHCDPPYTIDQQGVRTFKKECL
jgi:hypothetical protein